MTKSTEGLTPAIKALTIDHEARVIGLSAKHGVPIEIVAERCAEAVSMVFREIEDASQIVVTHATTPTPSPTTPTIPITIIDVSETPGLSATPPFLLKQDRLIQTPAILTEYEIIDADTTPEDLGVDTRKLAPKQPTKDPEYTFEPDDTQVPINYMCPTPNPEDRRAYQQMAAQTLPCPPPPFILTSK